MYQRLRREKKEGIVFKRCDAGYGNGKNDDQIKIKFLESATLQVASIHPSKRSVQVQGFDALGFAVPLGSVTIPANHRIPPINALVEVEYLYAVKALVQPVYKGERTDQTLESCTIEQLKYKPTVSEDDVSTEVSGLDLLAA